MSQLKTTKRDSRHHKDTRWDRIRKRQNSGCPASMSLKTDTVRRFIEMDFIGKAEERMLNGEKDAKSQLNPALVMDMRHDMFRRHAQKLPLATLAHQRNTGACVLHNMAVEERYIDQELAKLRQQLQKNHQRNTVNKRKVENVLKIDIQQLKRSLEASSRHVQDFYEAPMDALQDMEAMWQLNTAFLEDENQKEIRTDQENYRLSESKEKIISNTKKSTLREHREMKEKNFEIGEEVIIDKIEIVEDNLTKEKPEIKVENFEEVKQYRLNENENLQSNEQTEKEGLGVIQTSIESVEREVRNKIEETASALDSEEDSSKYKQINEIQVNIKRNMNKIKEEIPKAIKVNGDDEEVESLPKIPIRTPSPLTTTDEIMQRVRNAAEEQQNARERCVRFETEVAVHKFKRESSTCSNTSDGIDSVISDLAEEALRELQLEEQTAKKSAMGEKVPINSESLAEEEKEFTVGINNLQISGEGIAAPRIGQSPENNLLIIQRLKVPTPIQKASDNKEPESLLSNSTDEEDAETVSNHEQNLIIEQLFQARAHTNVSTVRKYFLKWIHYTTMEKIEREQTNSKTDRIHLINLFLDKVRREKVRHKHKEQWADGESNVGTRQVHVDHKPQQAGSVFITKKYKNKIKMQQDIIDLQRLKLERQERLIMQLKLNKLSDAVKEARQDLKNELKSVIRSGDPKAKAKAKCLQIIGDLRDAEDEEAARLQCKAMLAPKFLEKMQERAVERSVRHERARQRRLQQEADKEAAKIAIEEAKRLEDEEAKRLRIEALKEKRRQEKLAKILKERERQHAIQNHRKSQDFLRKLLLRRVGMEGFKRLVQLKHDNQRKCELFRRELFKKQYFMVWRDYYVFLCEEKWRRAEELHEKILKRRALAVWCNYVSEECSKYNVAVDWHELRLSECVFTRWWRFTKRSNMLQETRMRQAAAHHEWQLKWKVLDCWQRLPQVLQLERETEERRQRWRLKIWELLPDYTPNRDEFLMD